MQGGGLTKIVSLCLSCKRAKAKTKKKKKPIGSTSRGIGGGRGARFKGLDWVLLRLAESENAEKSETIHFHENTKK
jgi:hypothetical protein